MTKISPLAAESWIRRHKRNGRAYGNYFGYYRFPDEEQDATRRVNLHTRERQTAKGRLQKVIQDEHAVREGLAPPPERVRAAKRSLAEYIPGFIADLESRDLSTEYVRKARERLPRLFRACGWLAPKDISQASFEVWRRGADELAAKTKNDYLSLARLFAGWLIGQAALESNPLGDVKRARASGRQKRPRRPLTLTEVSALLVSTPCPRRRMLYHLAVSSGGRLGELVNLRWTELDLDRSVITFRAEYARNRKTQQVPLPSWMPAVLRAYRPADAATDGLVFKSGIGRHSFDHDLQRAGIAKTDAVGRAATFHCLRNTYNQFLESVGASTAQRVRLMRHSPLGLTNGTYLDSDRIGLREVVDRLPSFQPDTARSTPDSARSTAEPVVECHSVSRPVALTNGHGSSQSAEKTAGCRRLTPYDAERRQPASKWSRGDSNPRPGTVSRAPLRV